MDCNSLTKGIPKNCGGTRGGIKRLFLSDWENIVDITLDSPIDDISAITMAVGTTFYEFVFNPQSSTFNEKVTGDSAIGTQINTQTINLVLARREKSKRDVIKNLFGFKKLGAIVEDEMGKFWLLGEASGLRMNDLDSQAGTKGVDPNGYTIILVAEELDLANEVQAAAVTAVI